MNKTELVAAIATEMNSTKVAAEKALESVLTVIGNTLVSGEDVNLVGFGSFKIKNVEEHMATNPATGEKVPVAAHRKVVFKISSNLKDAVR